jgi:predicted DNA-binding transcriptional regulator AlpA
MNYHPEIPQTGFVTTAWVKKRYSISNSTLYQWIADRYLPAPVKIGPRAVRFSSQDIQRFEASLMAQVGKGR